MPSSRPSPGALEQRSAPVEGTAPTVEGNRLHGLVPFGVESRDLGGWTEVLAPGCLANADRSRLVVNVDHGGLPLGRFPSTLTLEDRDDGLHWSVELPQSRADVREAIERGDLDATSWRMVVGRESWEGSRRTVHEIRALHDVAVVVNAAYPTHAELRSAPEPEVPEPEEAPPVPEVTNPAGGLRVEERTATEPEERNVEARVVEALRAVRRGEVRDLTNATAEPISQPEVSTYLWDRLRPASVLLAAGATVITTDRQSVVWPRLLTDVDPTWVAETIVIPEGDPTFGQLEAKPKKLAHRIELSNEVIDDSEPSIVDVLNGHLATMLALKFDRSAFEGNPAADLESVRGLKYTSGTQAISMGTNGAPLTDYDPFLAAVGALRAANVAGPYAIVANPRTLLALELLRRETGSNEQLGAPAGLPSFFTTPQLSVTETKGTASNASSAFVFAPREVVVVRRQDSQIEMDRSRLFDRDMSEIRAKLRADVIIPNPQAVVRVDGIIPAA
jgi:HK97 family phage major capsid protein